MVANPLTVGKLARGSEGVSLGRVRSALTQPKTLLMFASAVVWFTLLFRLVIGQSWFEAILGGVLIAAFFAGGQAFARSRSAARRS
jgi:hypothetical protein